jgi:hypothetical protein
MAYFNIQIQIQRPNHFSTDNETYFVEADDFDSAVSKVLDTLSEQEQKDFSQATDLTIR